MARIKLLEQPYYEFKYEVTLQPRDINYGGHMGNDALISLVNTARADLFRSIGIDDLNMGDDKTGIIMVDLAVNYKSEAFLFDVLQIDGHIGEIGRNSFRIFHRATKAGGLLALVETGYLTFNYALRKSVPIPKAFIQALEERVKEIGELK